MAPLDAARVDASGEAYQMFRTPDAAIGLASLAMTLVLAGMGDRRRSQKLSLVPLAFAAKAALDAGFAGYLTLEQVTKHRRLCSWCLITAVTAVATVPRTVPEARAAWRHLRGGG